MIRILLIMGNMGLGGAETQVMKIYRTINRASVQFDFCINTSKKNYYEDEILSLGGNIYRTIPKSLNLLKYAKQIYKLCKGDYDVVVKCSENASAWMEMCIAWVAGIKIRVVRSTNTRILSLGLPLLAHYVGRPLLNVFTNYKIAPAKEAGDWLFGKGRKDIILLPNGIKTQSFTFTETQRETMRKKIGVDKEIVFGTVGRMSGQKNQLFLLDVFCKIREEIPNSKLLIVGDGELRNQIEMKIKKLNMTDYVILTGKSNKVPQLLMAMDIFCLPSLYEGMPNCVIEAEATGLPCIVSDTITRDADLMGNVVYCPLIIANWVNELKSTNKINDRELCIKEVVNAGYDTNNIVLNIECFLYDNILKKK